MFIGASNQLGAFESGVAARLLGASTSVVAGAFVTLGVVALVTAMVPSLRRLDLETAAARGAAAARRPSGRRGHSGAVRGASARHGTGTCRTARTFERRA